MGRITTHVLDTRGRTSLRAGVKVVLTRLRRDARGCRGRGHQCGRGRVDPPAARRARAFATGHYEIMFHVGDYFRQPGCRIGPIRRSSTLVPLCFGVAEDAHYHVPLLVSALCVFEPIGAADARARSVFPCDAAKVVRPH